MSTSLERPRPNRRRLAGIAAGAALLLAAGTPVTPTKAGGTAAEPPEPPPSLDVCWLEFIDSLNICWQRYGQVPNFNLMGYAACVKGMLGAYEWCLGQVPTPNPPPARIDCRFRYLQALGICDQYPDPCFPNPDPPGGCTPDPAKNMARETCYKGAEAAYQRCRNFIPRAPTDPQGKLSVGPTSVWVEPLSKYLNVVVSIEPFGLNDWSRIEIEYAQPNPADPQNPGAWLSTPGGTLRRSPGSDLGDKPASVTLNIPPSIYEHGAEVIAVFFDLYGDVPAHEPVHGDVVLLRVMYNHHDLNRDGYIDNADVLIALTRYFAGEMTWAQYQAVLQAAGQ